MLANNKSLIFNLVTNCLSLVEMIGKQLCQVLKELKKYHIVHSMLIPRYIYVSENYVLKVTNFMYAFTLPKNQ
jgi:hypothetical protein